MAEASTLECPVCSEQYNIPKILTCNHTACAKCIVDWLRKAGQNGGCPLCREPILSPSASRQHDLDLEALVDNLPTDLSIVAKVESQKMLSSRHICMSCDNNIAATSFCLQCNMKLCKSCAKAHKKFPAMKKHVVDDLDNLTAERLAEINRSPCKSHDDRLAEHYCPTHQELICLLCSSTSHRHCTDMKTIKEAAKEKREQFRQEAQRLRQKETTMRTQIKKTKDMFTDMRAKTNKVFDDLQQCVERRRQEVNDLIQAEEDKMALTQVDQVRAVTLSQAGVLDNLVVSAPDDALLDMEKAMTSRLEDLQRQTAKTDRVRTPAVVRFDSQKLTDLKSAIATLGQQGPPPTPTPPAPSIPTPATPSTSTPPTPSSAVSTSPKPRGAALARVLKVGDRVKSDRDCHFRGRGWRGTVTAVPSRRLSSQGEDPRGTVDVLWDYGVENCRHMGRDGRYELELE